jgi:FixJ family two-component response regulator
MSSPATATPTVHVVEDDASMRSAIVSLLRALGMNVEAYDSAEDFLLRRPPVQQPGCLLLDVRLPGSSGVDLQATLNQLGDDIPVVFLTGHGTIPMTVQAMRAGAVEFLTKPFTEAELLQAVSAAIERDRLNGQERASQRSLRERHALLTPREREVFERVAQGLMNKVIAAQLGITEITVKVHRRHVMEKLAMRTVADLVRAAEQLGIGTGSAAPPARQHYTKV